CAAGDSRGLPPGGLPCRRRGVRLQGDRRDHADADRHRDVTAAPGSPSAARAAHRLRPRARLRHREGQVMTSDEHDTSEGHDEFDCSRALLQAYDYLDGEMDPQDCAKIREHLAKCGPCLKEYD